MFINFAILLINSLFLPIVSDFESDYGKKIHPFMSISFSDKLDENTLAQCWMGQHKIEVNVNTWFQMSEIKKKFVLYHELGHCELDLNHVNDDKAIMRPYVFNEAELEDFKNNPKEYVDRLFDRDH